MAPISTSSRKGRLGFEKERGVTHLSTRENVSHVTVFLGSPDHEMAAVFRSLAEARVCVYLIKIHARCVDFAVDTVEVDTAEKVLTDSNFNVEIERDCALVSVVAPSMREISGVMSRIVGALHQASVEILEFADSFNSVSCLVRQSEKEAAIGALSAEFGVEEEAGLPLDPW